MRYIIPSLIFITILCGCSTNGTPVTIPPDHLHLTDSITEQSTPVCWGIWTIEYDHNTGELDVIPMRSSEGTWNVTMFLQPPAGSPANLGVSILDASQLVSEGRIDVRVTLNHPFPGPKLRGFDVRGVVMGNGSITDAYNADIIYPGQNDLRLLNADGYTRWMNAPEFTMQGILGYTPGMLGSNGFTPTATINGYKYFAELIESDQDVYNYFAGSLAFVTNRGSMTPGTAISRDYELRFPTAPLQVRFQYAIIAGWEKATSGGDTPSPADFPDNANAYEALGIHVVDSSDVYMEATDKKGGKIDLSLGIINWWAYWDADNLSDYINKIVITSDTIDLGSPSVEFDFSTLDQYPTSAGNAEAVDILIEDVEVSAVENQEILIAVEMDGYDYTNPFSIPNGAGSDPLTAYFIYPITVLTEYNDPPVITSGITGASDVFIMDSESYSVVATDDDSPTLTYEWTIHDMLNGDTLFGPSAGETDGIWNLDWFHADLPGDVQLRCDVSDGEKTVSANPLDVHVDDVLFHANLNDTTTGDNSGWTTANHEGITEWTSTVNDDDELQGYGYKFGPFNASYQQNSADILLTPTISLPSSLDRAVAVVFHSYSFEYYEPLEVGFDGGNFKITEAPAIPDYDTEEIDIIGGKDYDGWLFDTAISDQMAFASDQFVEELQVSAFEIPPAFIGTDITIGFAAATNEFDYAVNNGWLIDDVQVRAVTDYGNAPPIFGGPVTGDEKLPLLSEFPGSYEVTGYDIEDDPLAYFWTVRDPSTQNILWGPVEGETDGTFEIDWTDVGTAGEFEVHVSIYDGNNPGVAAPPLTVEIQEVIFHADFSDTTTGDNASWSVNLAGGPDGWTSSVGADSLLNGYGYKFGDFDTPYQASSQGILTSPLINIPNDIHGVSIYVRHDFEFIGTYDGGNFKVLKNTPPNYETTSELIDAGFDYDVFMDGTVLDNQKVFGIGQSNDNGLVSRMDLLNSYYNSSIYFGIACASGDLYFGMRGWMIDDVVVAITP